MSVNCDHGNSRRREYQGKLNCCGSVSRIPRSTEENENWRSGIAGSDLFPSGVREALFQPQLNFARKMAREVVRRGVKQSRGCNQGFPRFPYQSSGNFPPQTTDAFHLHQNVMRRTSDIRRDEEFERKIPQFVWNITRLTLDLGNEGVDADAAHGGWSAARHNFAELVVSKGLQIQQKNQASLRIKQAHALRRQSASSHPTVSRRQHIDDVDVLGCK
ncbi:hypothetical protein M413DRAFT_12144 [Hebeloma cylindrosporum]|uniref:Uncharacterized protein n=1 Tax=Hebeloma cylindrosporum TaxID=76867 RepID=A0A0C2YEW5_HEBCY|nr:hypothetical protein M413DRAFT_12144 [Hebeloma cylindrosporum h7]